MPLLSVHCVRQAVRRSLPLGLLSLGLWGLVGCSDLGGKPPLPSGIPDQQGLKTVAGARLLYQGAVSTFRYGTLNGGIQWGALLQSVLDQGLLSDELTVNSGGGTPLDYQTYNPDPPDYPMDSRNLPEGQDDGHSTTSYSTLQMLRARAAEAIGALAQYDTLAADKALRGHLYALTGYAELYLADLFCSGVPLSTFDYNKDFTYKPGSSTTEVYADAAQQFRQALPLLTDSVQWLNLARVGLGRALVNLGQYAAADTAVQAVPSDFVYQVPVDWSGGKGSPLLIGIQTMMADTEGGVGLPYRSSGDPRTRGVFVGQLVEQRFTGDSMFIPAKYGDGMGMASVTVASGLEARLIRAEAALHGSGGASAMLGVLDSIRVDSGLTTIALSAATETVAVDTLFTERAFWLYLDGHRLGDMRRLLRRYRRSIYQVFPTGPYRVPVPSVPGYGPDVEMPIPGIERQFNPYFTGCKSRGV